MLNDEKNILNTLFQVRDEELAMITKQDKENLREVNQRLKQEELKFKETINYLPKVMKQNKRNIICCIRGWQTSSPAAFFNFRVKERRKTS